MISETETNLFGTAKSPNKQEAITITNTQSSQTINDHLLSKDDVLDIIRSKIDQPVYHGSNVVVEHPQILKPNRPMDFGPGFYTTFNRKQAEKWAIRKARRNGTATLNIYSVDWEWIMTKSKILIMNEANLEWLKFVMSQRDIGAVSHGYDLVYGKIADGDVKTVLNSYQQSTILPDVTISLLNINGRYDPLVFSTQNALEHLHFEYYSAFG